MYRNARQMQQTFDDRRSEVLRAVADCGHLAPAILAARERLESEMERNARLREAGFGSERRPGRFRHWCGALAIRLGAWIGGDSPALGTPLPAPPQTEPRLP